MVRVFCYDIMNSIKVWELEAELSWMMRSGRLPESLSRAFDGSIRTEKPTDLSMAPHTRYEASCQSVRRWGLPSEKQRSEWSPRMSA